MTDTTAAKEQFKSQNPISRELERRGHKVVNRACRCPFHEDRNPSLTIDAEDRVWNCHAGCGGGDIFHLIMKFDGKTIKQVLDECVPLDKAVQFTPQPQQKQQSSPGKVETVYSYQNAHGKEVYQVCRLVPKSFRQRHAMDGKWVWNMDGVERVLYRLPEVLKAQVVWIVEGEKDADTLKALGFTATCNVGGAGKWLDAYSEALQGKDVVICGDNDKPGQEHVEKVFEALAGKVASARIVQVPKAYKDVTEYTLTFAEENEASLVVQNLFDTATVFVKGVKMPIYFMQEIEPAYKKHVEDLANSALDLGKWLPTLGRQVRALVPGELVLILGETGVGKTAILSNVAMCAKPIKTLFFEMELPAVLMYERLLSYQLKMSGQEIEKTYRMGESEALGKDALTKHFGHLAICTESKLTPEKIEQYIVRSELKFGEKPKLVLVDYAQLVQSKGGSRYERMSNTAEDLKIIAKETGTILFFSSQVGRKGKDDTYVGVGLCDGKDSGSLENSGGLVLGAWRDPKDAATMHIRILKNTKGQAGHTVTCNYEGWQQRITERADTQSGQEPPSYDND